MPLNRNKKRRLTTNPARTCPMLKHLKKHFAPLYLGVSVFSYCYYTYQDGTAALTDYRSGLLANKMPNLTSDWEAIKFGSNERAFYNFYRSVFFPKDILTNLTMKLVSTTNPKQELDQTLEKDFDEWYINTIIE